MIKAVLFDFGGVLLDDLSGMTVTEATIMILKSMRINVTESMMKAFKEYEEENIKKTLSTLIESRIEDIVSDILTIAKVPVSNELVNKIISFFEANLKYRLRPNAKIVLAKLKKKNMKIGLLSNTFSDFPRKILAKEGLIHLFDTIVLSRDIGYRKPHPVIFKTALQRLRTSPKETIFIGDLMEIDIAGARNVGMIAILMKSKESKWRDIVEKYAPKFGENATPDYVISDLMEIFEIIKDRMEDCR